MNTKIKVLIVLFFQVAIFSCKTESVPGPLFSDFALGKMTAFKKEKAVEGGVELTIITRYELLKGLESGTSNYFQYQLGNKIKLVVGRDTISPSLSYYVPLLKDKELEIDCKYLLTKEQTPLHRYLIVDDSIYNFQRINIPIQ